MAVRRVPRNPKQPLIGYEVRWRDPDGIQRKKLFKGQQKRAADAFFAETRTSLDRGQYIDVTAKTTVLEYTRQWVEIQPYRESSRERRESQIRTHLEPSRLGKIRMVAVKPSDLQAFASDRDKVLASESIRNLMGFIGAVFASAVADRVIGFHPGSNVSLSPAEHHPVVPLTVDQVKKLSAALTERLQVLPLVQTAIGVRIGELLALRLQDVDFLKREVRIHEQIHPRTRKRQKLKTPYSRRTIPLPQAAVDALAVHLAKYPANEDGYIFTNDLGLPYQAHSYQGAVAYRSETMGMVHITPHDFRHTYASLLLAAGESVVTVAARLGHRDANMVIRVYGHLIPGSEDRTRRAIDLAWKSASSVPSDEQKTG